MWKVLAGVITGIVLVWTLNAGSASPLGRIFSVPVHETEKTAEVRGASAQTTSDGITGMPGDYVQKVSQDSSNNPPQGGGNTGWSTTVTVDATSPSGVVVDLPSTGNYQFSVSGGYNTGTHSRTVVAVLDGAGNVAPCGQYSEPCADFWVGNWNTATPETQWKRVNSSQIRILAVDDLGSYTNGNSGSVTVTISSS